MKKIICLIVLSAYLLLLTSAKAEGPLKVETFRLDNGLKVILCE